MRVKNSLKNIYSGLIGQVILLLVNFITRTVFIKTLGSTYLGISGLFGNVLSLLSLAELGVGQAITFSLYKPIAEKDNEKITSLMSVYKKIYRYVCLFVLLVGLSLSPLLKYIIKDIDRVPDITIIYIMFVVNSAVSYLFIYKNTLLVASQKNYISTIVNSVTSIVVMVLQIIILLVFKNYLLYLGTQIIMTVIQNSIIANIANQIYPSLKSKDVKSLEDEEKNALRKNIGSLMIYKIGTLALNSTDNILISTFVGLTKVGIYSNYVLICSSITSFLSTIFGNLTASIGNLNATEDNDRSSEMFNIINLATFWLYGVCVICIFCTANDFIYAWIGNDYLVSIRELFVIILNVYIAGMLFAPYNYRQTMGLFVYGKIRPIISAIINIVASIILGKYFGLEGILWGTVIARCTTNVWFDPYIIFKKGMNRSPMPYFIDYIIKLILLFACGACCYMISNLIPRSGFWTVIGKGITSFIVCNLIFIICWARSSEFKYLLNIFNIILKGKKQKSNL